jgi:hypothetical protein
MGRRAESRTLRRLLDKSVFRVQLLAISLAQASHRSGKRYFNRWQKDLAFEVGELV